MPVTISIRSTEYGLAYLKSVWSRRHEIPAYEQRGLFNFAYITICSYIESFIAAYLSFHLIWPTQVYRTPNKYFVRQIVDKTGSHDLSGDNEQKMILRLLERNQQQINKANFTQLKDLNKDILGVSISEIVGSALNDDLEGLVALRNLLAHGREIIISSGDDEYAITPQGHHISSNVSFEKHPLENTMKSLRQAGLYVNETAETLENLRSIIYREEAIKHFWNSVLLIEKKYIDTLEVPLRDFFSYSPRLFDPT